MDYLHQPADDTPLVIRKNKMAATVIFHRPKRAWVERKRAWGLHLDGPRIEKVENGKSASLSVSPGAHTLEIHVDWSKSKPFDFDIADGETIELYGKGHLLSAHWINLTLLLLPLFIVASFIPGTLYSIRSA